MHMCAQTHGRAYVQSHTPTHPYVYTPMYARVRTYTRTRRNFFLTANLLYSITKPSSIISPTPFISIIQSLYNPYQYWHHIGCAICTNCCHLTSYVTHSHSPKTIFQLSTIHLPYISHLLSLPSIILNTILSLSNVQSNYQPSYQYVNML